jgi:hypothetical protein
MTAGEGPVGVSSMNAAERAEPEDGRASTASVETRAIKRRRRTMTGRP